MKTFNIKKALKKVNQLPEIELQLQLLACLINKDSDEITTDLALISGNIDRLQNSVLNLSRSINNIKQQLYINDETINE